MNKLKYWFGNKEPKEDVYITQNTIDYFNNMIIKYDKKQRELELELQRKDNIINELKEWLKNSAAGNWVEYNEAINDVLNKIEELENGNK